MGPGQIAEVIQRAGEGRKEHAADDAIHDAGVIATPQLGLHQDLAVHGTLASNAERLGLEEDAAALRSMAAEIWAHGGVYGLG